MEIVNKQPVLTLLGAGPGDPELITLKGIKALEKAKVVLYDALVSDELLQHTTEFCVKVFVGKRSGKHSFTQEEINNLIVNFALEYGSVLRLKGGDPFVFGRGSEEIEYAAKYGIKSEIIPGISTSTSLTALNGISLTKRGVNHSFWVVNGTLKTGKISSDFYLAARSSATVVVLMGRKKLDKIVRYYQSIDKGDEAIAIIQNGSLPTQKFVVGTIDTIEEIAAANEVGTPAILVIGKVVESSNKSELLQSTFNLAI